MNIRSRLAIVAAIVVFGAPARADEPDLDPLRDRFKVGMEKYRSGDFAGAVESWRAIYAELGREKGYRVAFNVARAYERLAAAHAGSPESFREATRAAEHYADYVHETTRRREAGETLEPLLEKQEREAKERLGSIVIDGDASMLVKVDSEERHASSTVWVVPGQHVVTFRPGAVDQDVHTERVDVGAEVHVAPSPPRVAPPLLTTMPPPPRFETRTERPYDSAVLWAAAGVTAASVAIPIALFAHANGVADDYYAATNDRDHRRLAGDYASARSTTYASYAIPAILGAVTLALVTYWFYGKHERTVRVGKRE